MTDKPYMQSWILVSKSIPPEGLIVSTKIHDEHGLRNEQNLKRIGNLWWHPDGKMYVYYRPTHWKFINL